MAPASISVSEAAAEAARLAEGAKTLDELIAAIEGFEGSPVKATANRTVIFDGNPDSGVMIIGEAPGAEEDRQGKPFVGAAGRLLDQMLAAIGLDRDHAYITNVFFWRPPGNRTPTPQEIALCQPFVRRHVELVRPKAILAMGGTSAKSLFDTDTGITRLRGQWKDVAYGTVTVPTLASFHPAYLLRQPAQKRLSWEDLLAFKARVESAQ
ncbi:uracil-DNA glycosylase [Pedomonas mirosovicensis]|uniref:uracil-DNA glycosylase n=1 Tax=Pedomonas mirosovicensis TaxID=2908641 RepID=UPI002168FFC4|nr:uracil-DNA glycosylase [Pedomonas mirosovicensis]MCH8685618.1 uracil-DNA glycosylase [Pedomonas mirosovicensis]